MGASSLNGINISFDYSCNVCFQYGPITFVAFFHIFRPICLPKLYNFNAVIKVSYKIFTLGNVDNFPLAFYRK